MIRVVALLLLGLVVAFFVVSRGDRSDAPAVAATPAAPASWLIVPVAGVKRTALVDSWHDARDNGARVHEALDIMAPGGTPVVAAMDGTIEKLHLSAAGGITAYERSRDGHWVAYYAHLQRYADGLVEGQAVKQGAAIGFVGDTGNAGAGNTHLHFALQKMAAGERWYQGTPVNPYPMLAAKAPSR